jgi:hypothetical protein
MRLTYNGPRRGGGLAGKMTFHEGEVPGVLRRLRRSFSRFRDRAATARRLKSVIILFLREDDGIP